jgi:very-short-patch-repair endonuclease
MTLADFDELRDLRLQEVARAGDNQRRRWIANRALEMRLSPTLGEIAMQAILKESECVWYPQYILGRYIVDFYCPALNLLVEVDGSAHQGQGERDAKRQNWLQQQGYNGFRTTNLALMEQPWQVAADLEEWIWKVVEQSA